MFDQGREWAYSAIRDHWAPNGLSRWSEAVLARLSALNGQFLEPLPFSEVKATARSIAKWTWRNITPQGRQELIQRTHTPERQAERGRKGGLASTNQGDAGVASGQARRVSREPERAAARLMRAQGMSIRQVAGELGVSVGTVHAWVS